METKYRIIGRATVENTQSVANEFAKEGWIPTGEIVVNPHNSIRSGKHILALTKAILTSNLKDFEYRIIGRSDISNLENVVNELIDEGFLPIGSIKINPKPDVYLGTYIQTMSNADIFDINTFEVEERCAIGRPTIQNLESVVKELMQEDWIPLGGMEINPKPSLELGHFIQNMIKAKPRNKTEK